jgi:regulatory protein
MSELQFPDSGQRDIRRTAIKLLTRREHSAQELRAKLMAKGFDSASVERILADLQQEQWQSDVRYAEAYINSRRGKGVGPVRLRQELKERGVEEATIALYIDPGHTDWRRHIQQVREKRFGAALPQTAQDKAKQMRFLQYRGFTGDQIRFALKHLGEE